GLDAEADLAQRRRVAGVALGDVVEAQQGHACMPGGDGRNLAERPPPRPAAQCLLGGERFTSALRPALIRPSSEGWGGAASAGREAAWRAPARPASPDGRPSPCGRDCPARLAAASVLPPSPT